MNPGIRASW